VNSTKEHLEQKPFGIRDQEAASEITASQSGATGKAPGQEAKNRTSRLRKRLERRNVGTSKTEDKPVMAATNVAAMGAGAKETASPVAASEAVKDSEQVVAEETAVNVGTKAEGMKQAVNPSVKAAETEAAAMKNQDGTLLDRLLATFVDFFDSFVGAAGMQEPEQTANGEPQFGCCV